MIAQARGDYAQAEQRYQASLIIAEELGDRAGIANSYHQFGVLRTKQDRPGEGIPYIISALAIHLDLESPDVSTSLFWLGKQRQEVGEESFMQILGGLLDADRVQFVIDELNSIRNGGDPD